MDKEHELAQELIAAIRRFVETAELPNVYFIEQLNKIGDRMRCLYPPQPLCEDEGCPHYGTDHVCLNSACVDGKINATQAGVLAWREHVAAIKAKGAPSQAPSDTALLQPSYYGGKADPYEPFKVIRAWGLNFFTGNALKYIRRAGLKDDRITAYKKAREYLTSEIEALEATATHVAGRSIDQIDAIGDEIAVSKLSAACSIEQKETKC